MSIRKITARRIYDQCGNPALEIDLTSDLGCFRASVSNGNTECVEDKYKNDSKV